MDIRDDELNSAGEEDRNEHEDTQPLAAQESEPSPMGLGTFVMKATEGLIPQAPK